jgi:maltooligosyltrehalose trehalohydrolase
MRPGDARRRYSIGAEPLSDGDGAHFRVWAPRRRSVQVVLVGDAREPVTLTAEDAGYFSGPVPGAGVGTRYSFRLDGEEKLYPDPASRFQPEGPHGPSEIVDPHEFAWTDDAWRGIPADQRVIYEMHVGTFTPEGTYAAAAGQLVALKELGITIIELMPLAEFPGGFGWGYDGVDLWAPTRLYGRPDDLRRFVDAAHAAGLGVILDVVYNHLGPDGNYLSAFSPDYFTDRHANEWGSAINFDGEGSAAVRQFYVENAGYWIDEFHLDGLRLDATQAIMDASPEHVLTAIGRRVREASGSRTSFVVAENEPQHSRLARASESGGYGLDALWNDDFHHTAVVALTGRAEAYYSDYRGTPQELLSASRWGYLFQGQRYRWQKKARGTPALDLPASAFVCFLENHDQVANSGAGKRLHQLTSPGQLRAMTTLLLLQPATPMLFQGQEFAASAPFLYFADHEKELGGLVAKGRRVFLEQFPSLTGAEAQSRLLDPGDPRTFAACKLDLSERDRGVHVEAHTLHRDLLRVRRETPAFQQQRADRMYGAVLSDHAFMLRFQCEKGDRLLLVNLGGDLELNPAPEPLLAPPEGRRWRVSWSSESPAYGGAGPSPIELDGKTDSDADRPGAWMIPGHAAVVLEPCASDD